MGSIRDYFNFSFKISNLVTFLLLIGLGPVACGMGAGGGLEGSNQMLGDQGVGGKNAPNYPDGVAIPEPERNPCLDKEHCEEETEAKLHQGTAPTATHNSVQPDDIQDHMHGDDIPDAPSGTIKPPGKK